MPWEEPKPLESRGWEGGWQPAPAKFRAHSGGGHGGDGTKIAGSNFSQLQLLLRTAPSRCH